LNGQKYEERKSTSEFLFSATKAKFHHTISSVHDLSVTKPDCYTTYRSFATRMSQLKICNFSGESFKNFEVL